jgi:ATP-dependent DNA ligase
MEALPVERWPAGGGCQYEPKWDGFRCLLFRDGEHVALQSKSGEPLERYFPELVQAALAVPARRFVLDGEIVIPAGAGLSFDDLLQRIHPAASRVRRLAAEHPALLIVFDLLVDDRGRSLVARPLSERRRALEAFARRSLARVPALALSPATTRPDVARRWFEGGSAALDGVVAKWLDAAYASGERTAMQKIKHRRTADCVVGGFRYAAKGRSVGSLLLGLHDDEGRLHHVGFTSSLPAADRRALTPKLERLVRPPGFTGRAPGRPSRWSRRAAPWHPLRPTLVAEVEYDHFTGHRFRHGTRFVRWRPDKSPAQCTFAQVQPARSRPLRVLLGGRARTLRGATRPRQGATRPRAAARG